MFTINWNFYYTYRDGKEWQTYRQILNRVMFKDLNANLIKSYNIVINDILTEWENYTGLVVPNLIADLYKISISCKFLYNNV